MDPSAFWDAYSATKARAEGLILAANGMRLVTLAAETDPEGAAMAVPGEHRGKIAVTPPPPSASQRVTRSATASSHKPSAANALPSTPGSGKGISAATAPAAPPLRLQTCAIRPGGIYGPGECRHLPRIVGMVRA